MNLMRRSALAGAAALAAVAVAAIVTGCPPGLDDPERFTGACPADYSVESMLRERCSGASCHGGTDNLGGGLDLASAGAFERMYGHPSGACGEMLISPEGPEKSLLFQKIDGTTTCGAKMPLGADPLSTTDLACVRAWITQGIDGGTLPNLDAGPDGDTGSSTSSSSASTTSSSGTGGAGTGGSNTGGTGGSNTGGASAGGAGGAR
ncbi:Isopentenyl-diphosphate delta-isomerase [Minicystis rosea]|nr:Isopentenyl-diphosphate delta-isomerase [Minicystis rosea]